MPPLCRMPHGQQAGITIILVTHDANIGQHARRIIHIHDGRMSTDSFGAVAGTALNQGGTRSAAAEAGGMR